MTASQLRDLFVSTLLKRAGGTRRQWRVAVGEVRVYSPATHPHCNWSVTPSGSSNEVAWVEHVADELRAREAIVTPG